MVVVRGNPVIAILGLIVSLVIFGVMYFTVVKPSMDQTNGAIEDARERIRNTPTYVAPPANPSSPEVNKAVENAQKQADCVLAAGTDTDKLAACAK